LTSFCFELTAQAEMLPPCAVAGYRDAEEAGMAKKTVRDLPPNLSGKRVLVRFDLNVGIDEITGEIRNDRRIRASLPTLKLLLERGAAVVALSHLGRPKPDNPPAKNAPFAMDRVAARLAEYLKRPVLKANDVAGPDANARVAALKPGDALLLENVRFHPFEQPLEKKKNPTPEQTARHQQGMEQFARELGQFGDIYVNDAFGTLQNKDVSVLALPKAMSAKPRVIGLLVEDELAKINALMDHSQPPMLAIMGGAKVSDKINFIKVLLTKVDTLLIGGKMTYTFLKAQGVEVGGCLIDPQDEDLVRKALLSEVGRKIVLPVDYLVAQVFEDQAKKLVIGESRVVEGPIPAGFAGVDIGPKTLADYTKRIERAATVIWNGPVGWFEQPAFCAGTRGIADALAKVKARGGSSVVGGGETAEAVEEFGLVDQMSHVSTGGGAFLKYVEDRDFATLKQIEDK
jgi:phosphoglycerate kinase